jgi:hypothetical protein
LFPARRNHGAPATRLYLKAVQAGNTLRRQMDERGSIAMANILVCMEKGIEIAATDALKWLTSADKALHVTPTVVAALATLIGACQKPLTDLSGAAANPLNIALDIETVTDLKAAWPDVAAFMSTLGVKI